MSHSTEYRSPPSDHVSDTPSDRRRRIGTAPWAWAAAVLFLVAGMSSCATAGPSFTDTSLSSAEIRELDERYSSAYDFLQAHGRVIFAESGRTGDEVMLVYERGRGSINMPGSREGALYVDNREIPDPIPYLRDLSLTRVETLRILRASETSARHGGDGRTGAVSITTRGS